MTKANILPHITWGHTKANHVDIELPEIDYIDFSSNPGTKGSEDFNKVFENKKYGVSDSVKELNEKYRNYSEYYEFTGQEDLRREFKLTEEISNINDLHEIHVREGSNAKILFDYRTEADIEAFRNSIFKINAEKNSEVKIVIVQRLSHKSQSYVSLISEIAEDARVHLVHVELGSKKAYANYEVELVGARSESDIKTAYFVDGNRYLDLAYVMTHYGQESDSDMVLQGVLKDHAEKRFAGTLDFLKGCRLSTGNEEEFVTLLDPTVKSRAIPILLAREDDIVGNHAASAGRVDKEMLFYIQSRGFDQLEAKRIIIESKIKPILDLIEDIDLRNELLEDIRQGIREWDQKK